MKAKLLKLKPKNGAYYDLIHLPHGHIPVPRCNFWSSFPIPLKDYRDENYYRCPECKTPSFYQITDMCWECQTFYDQYYSEIQFLQAQARTQRRQRRRYFKRFLKTIEYWLLPFLVLLGKAWYVKAIRRYPVWEETDNEHYVL